MKNDINVHQLLKDHGFLKGWTINTVYWWAKSSYEFRLLDNGFKLIYIRAGKFIETPFPDATIADLENTIYFYGLHQELLPRQYSNIYKRLADEINRKAKEQKAAQRLVESNKKRKAKRVEKFSKVA